MTKCLARVTDIEPVVRAARQMGEAVRASMAGWNDKLERAVQVPDKVGGADD